MPCLIPTPWGTAKPADAAGRADARRRGRWLGRALAAADAQSRSAGKRLGSALCGFEIPPPTPPVLYDIFFSVSDGFGENPKVTPTPLLIINGESYVMEQEPEPFSHYYFKTVTSVALPSSVNLTFNYDFNESAGVVFAAVNIDNPEPLLINTELELEDGVTIFSQNYPLVLPE